MPKRIGIIEDWIIKIPSNEGAKSLKIELYKAGHFREHFDLYDREKWFPKPPFRSNARRTFWQQRYRVKVNGFWYGAEAKYRTYTKHEIFKEIVMKADDLMEE